MEDAKSDLANRQATAGQEHLCLIDGLRGLAAFAVVMLHYYHFFYIQPEARLHPDWRIMEPGSAWLEILYVQGLYAVNVFWMISGFVFAYVYCGTVISTRAFLVHRIARLYPLHLLTLGTIAVLQFTALQRLGHYLIYTNNDWRNFVQHLFFASGWELSRIASFNAPIWSVSIELLVYGLFWVLRGWLHRTGFAAALAIAIVAGLLVATGRDSLIIACAIYFFAGSAVALVWRKISHRPWIWSLLSGILLALGYVALRSQNEVVSIGLGLTGFFGGILLLLVGCERHAWPSLRRAAQWLGDATYSAYLWHVPMQIALLLVLIGRTDVMHLASQGWFLAAWLLAVLAVGRLSFVWFEAPARDYVRRALLPRRKGGDTGHAFAYARASYQRDQSESECKT